MTLMSLTQNPPIVGFHPFGSSRRLVVAVRRGPYRDVLTSPVLRFRSRHSRGADSCPRYSEDHNEAAISAQRAQAGQEAWIPFADEFSWRTRCPSLPSPEGSRPTVGVIDRLSGRADFGRLRAEGVRHGRGPVRLVSRPDPSKNARIAFAIPRSVGNAVVRNRIRRRIRAVLQDLHREDAAFPARGDHLIRVTAPLDDWSHTTLRLTMTTLMKPESLAASTSETR
jgi:ribonuclease P protein component